MVHLPIIGEEEETKAFLFHTDNNGDDGGLVLLLVVVIGNIEVNMTAACFSSYECSSGDETRALLVLPSKANCRKLEYATCSKGENPLYTDNCSLFFEVVILLVASVG